MLIGRSQGMFLALAASLLLPIAQPAMAADDDDSAKDETVATEASKPLSEPSLEEMRKHRIRLREDLMVPSLKGVRGVCYGLPGHFPNQGLEKAVSNSLGQLPVPITKMTDLEKGVTKPVDAMLQVKVLKAGNSYSVVELGVTQWCSLLRDPDTKVKTITYCDQAVTHDRFVRDTVVKMVDQFVIDFMKANNKTASVPAEKTDVVKKKKKTKDS